MVAPNEKFVFKKTLLDSVPVPETGKRYTYKDDKERGLILRVTSSGKKTFALYQKHNGRPVRVTIGNYPEMSIEKARKKAVEERARFQQGINPNVEKHKIRDEMTFKELFEQYMERYSKVQKKSWKYDEREVNKFLTIWFNRKISDIHKHEVVRLFDKITKDNGKYQANRILERVRAIFNKAIEWGWDGRNPTLGIKKHKETARTRFVQIDELPFLFKALLLEHNKVASDFLFVALLAGARKTNTLQMQWEQIDWSSGTWVIPDTKNGEPQTVYLSKPVLEVLRKRKKLAQGEPWVFPSESGAGHLVDPKKAWTRVRQHATMLIWAEMEHLKELVEPELDMHSSGVDVGTIHKNIVKKASLLNKHLPKGLMDLRLHDLRRTFGSYQANSGVSLQIVGASLGHKSMDATKVYSVIASDPVKQAVEHASSKIWDLGNGND